MIKFPEKVCKAKIGIHKCICMCIKSQSLNDTCNIEQSEGAQSNSDNKQIMKKTIWVHDYT